MFVRFSRFARLVWFSRLIWLARFSRLSRLLCSILFPFFLIVQHAGPGHTIELQTEIGAVHTKHRDLISVQAETLFLLARLARLSTSISRLLRFSVARFSRLSSRFSGLLC